jgi:putative tricarboxylic transport membrane protein
MAKDVQRPWWVGVTVTLIGAIWLYGAADLTQGSAMAVIGPGLFVTAVGAALVLFGVAYTVQVMTSRAEIPTADAEDGAVVVPFRPGAFALALAAVAAPYLIMKVVGFPITATLVFAGVARAFGSRRLLLDLAIGAVVAVVSWFAFTWLGVNLGSALPLLKI